MAFPRRLLSDGEELVIDSRPHWIALVGPVALAVLILAAMAVALVRIPDSWPAWSRWAIVAAAVVLLLIEPVPRFVRWATSHFVVTTDRLIHRSGWVAKRSMEIPLEKISDVRFHQGVFERMIGAGDLTIESPGEYGQETFSHIRRPEHVQKVIYEMGEQNQRRMTTPTPAPAPADAVDGGAAPGGSGSISIADELAKLERLRADGALSDSEFQAAKARLLDQG